MLKAHIFSIFTYFSIITEYIHNMFICGMTTLQKKKALEIAIVQTCKYILNLIIDI